MQVWGNLSIGTMSGKAMYAGDGVLIARTNDSDNPDFDTPSNNLVILEKVPERYAEKIVPGKTLTGIGKLLSTNEDVSWEMWHATRPIKR